MTTATAPSRTGARRRGSAAAGAAPRRDVARREAIRAVAGPSSPSTSSRSAPTGSEHSTLRDARSGRPAIRSRRRSFETDGSPSPARPRRRRLALRELARGGRQPAPWLSPVPVTNSDARPPGHGARLPLRRGRSPHRQLPPACLGVGRGVRRLPVAPGRDDELAPHPVRSRCGLSRVRRGALQARWRPYVPPQPWNSGSRRTPGRSERRRHRARSRETKGRVARAALARTRRDCASRRATLPRGGTSSGSRARGRLREREHASDARAGRARIA